MGLIRLSDEIHEELRHLKHKLSEENRKEFSFSETVKFLLEFYRKNRGVVERLVGM